MNCDCLGFCSCAALRCASRRRGRAYRTSSLPRRPLRIARLATHVHKPHAAAAECGLLGHAPQLDCRMLAVACYVRVACRVVLGAWCRLLIACCTVHVDCWLLGRPCMLYVVVACCVLSFHSVACNACYRFILWHATLHDMQRAVLHVSCLPKLVVACACCMVHGSSHVARAE